MRKSRKEKIEKKKYTKYVLKMAQKDCERISNLGKTTLDVFKQFDDETKKWMIEDGIEKYVIFKSKKKESIWKFGKIR